MHLICTENYSYDIVPLRVGAVYRIGHAGSGQHAVAYKSGNQPKTSLISVEPALFICDEVIVLSGYVGTPESGYQHVRIEGVPSEAHWNAFVKSFCKYHGGLHPMAYDDKTGTLTKKRSGFVVGKLPKP